MYIGGAEAARRQLQPPVLSPDGAIVGEAGEGNRKDIRDAVEAAAKAASWAAAAAHLRPRSFYVARTWTRGLRNSATA